MQQERAVRARRPRPSTKSQHTRPRAQTLSGNGIRSPARVGRRETKHNENEKEKERAEGTGGCGEDGTQARCSVSSSGHRRLQTQRNIIHKSRERGEGADLQSLTGLSHVDPHPARRQWEVHFRQENRRKTRKNNVDNHRSSTRRAIGRPPRIRAARVAPVAQLATSTPAAHCAPPPPPPPMPVQQSVTTFTTNTKRERAEGE